ncbi:MAG: OprO/OprP family phosphate-selective porin [Cyclobacteriaceae bacterium]|nr:OprO/OprP family phosphate-selective porin [Cyclobacteriaceae bacterium]
MKILSLCVFALISATLLGNKSALYAQEIDLPFQEESRDSIPPYMEVIPGAFSEVPYFTFGQGVGIFPTDSSFSLNLRFRMQNRLGATFQEGDSPDIEARVRRLRLRFDGFVVNPKISYVMQLSFSRADMDWENTNVPNVVRDAMVFYDVNSKLRVGFGQTKLPGNRQRVISSGDLQFVDRSIVNATLNIDRDFGIHMAYTEQIYKNFHTVFRSAISSGDGRNIINTNDGLAYTGRIEVLPFGLFERFGDYFEGDLIRESKPKLSAGFTYSLNQQTLRTGGQIGLPLFEPRDMTTLSTDWLLKYSGFAISAELLYRQSDDPITTDGSGDIRYVYAGLGQNFQASYVWLNDYELALRYSQMSPSESIQALEPEIYHYTLGLTKYVKGHRVKLQTDLTYEQRNFQVHGVPNENLQWRFQIELGI